MCIQLYSMYTYMHRYIHTKYYVVSTYAVNFSGNPVKEKRDNE